VLDPLDEPDEPRLGGRLPVLLGDPAAQESAEQLAGPQPRPVVGREHARHQRSLLELAEVSADPVAVLVDERVRRLLERAAVVRGCRRDHEVEDQPLMGGEVADVTGQLRRDRLASPAARGSRSPTID